MNKPKSKEKLHIGIIRTELYGVHSGTHRILMDTIARFRDVDDFLIGVCCDHHKEITSIPTIIGTAYIEKLVHATAKNPSPEYPDFDKRFYKFPSYMRRAAINTAIGHIKSHETRCDQYYDYRQTIIDRGHHFTKMEPGFCFTPKAWPTLYKRESFSLNGRTVEIKAFVHNTWDWVKVKIPYRDYKSLLKAQGKGEIKNPKLVYDFGKFYLEFPVEYDVAEFPQTRLEDQTVLSVDLGFNRAAVCSHVDYYGTVYGRYYDPFHKDMDCIDHMINKIRKVQKTSGKGQSLSKVYTKLNGLKENFVKQLSRWIVNTAKETGVYGIVLENLNSVHKKGSKGGSLKARVQHWCVAKIRKLVKGMAFREGIRVFVINPTGTSEYAFDGSGLVKRDKDNNSLCTFTTGKRYDCDLSASYNIAARYFLRSLLKSTPAKAWSELKAKVPGLSERTRWTLATLRSVVAYS